MLLIEINMQSITIVIADLIGNLLTQSRINGMMRLPVKPAMRNVFVEHYVKIKWRLEMLNTHRNLFIVNKLNVK